MSTPEEMMFGGGNDNSAAAAPMGEPSTTTQEAHDYAKRILDKYMVAESDSGAATSALMDKYASSTDKAKQILAQAQQKLTDRQNSGADLWLQIGKALGAPTRTGSFGEGISNVAGGVQDALQQGDQRQKELTQLGLDSAGLDQGMAKTQMDAMKAQLDREQRAGSAALRLMGREVTPSGGKPQLKWQDDPAHPGMGHWLAIDPTAGTIRPVGGLMPHTMSAQDAFMARLMGNAGGGASAAAPAPVPGVPGAPQPTAPADAAAPAPPAPKPVDPITQSILNYDSPPPTPRQMNTPAGRMQYDRLMAANPNYDAKIFPTAQATLTAFAKGPEQKLIRANNATIAHLDILGQASDALERNDTLALNKISNAWKEQTGSELPTNMEMVAHLAGNELAKATVNGPTALADRDAHAKEFSSYKSAAQIKGGIATAQALLGGQLNALRTQYEANIPGRKDFNRLLTPASVRAESLFMQHANGAGGGGGPPVVTTKAQYDALDKGTTFIGADGKSYTRH